MTLKHEINKDSEEIIINVKSFGQYVPVHVSYKKDNFKLNSTTLTSRLKVMEFVIENFYGIMVSNKDRHFKMCESKLVYGDNENPILVIVDDTLRRVNIYITEEGTIELDVQEPKMQIKDILEKITLLKSAFADKNYEEIIIKELKGELQK